jgi:tetratricopeptide (TPR) repeat protein
MPYPHLIVEDIMSKINRKQKLSQWLLSREKKLYLFSWDNVPIYKNFKKWLQRRETKFTEWLLRIEIRKRFTAIFLLALIFGLIYRLTAYFIDYYCQKSYDIHFQMSADFAGSLLVESIGYAVLIYGFFAAFLIYTISEIQKVPDKEYRNYRKVMSKVLNIFAVVTGFVVDFIFFSILSMYVLEKIKLKVEPPVVDFPILILAHLLFFMFLIILLGYLVFSLVIGLLNVRSERHYSNRGVAYGNLKQYERAIEEDPNFAEAYYNRGVAYGNLKQYERAIEDYNKAIELDPNHTSAYYNRGNAYYYLKQYERAIEDYNKTIELDPNHAKAYNNREVAISKSKEQEGEP